MSSVFVMPSSTRDSHIAKLGTISWYKDGGATAAGTGATLAVSAASVSSKAVYTCQLEG